MTERRPGSARGAAVVACVLLLCGIVLVPAVGAAAPEWNIDRVGAPASAAGTVIAVVDTGVGRHALDEAEIRTRYETARAGLTAAGRAATVEALAEALDRSPRTVREWRKRYALR